LADGGLRSDWLIWAIFAVELAAILVVASERKPLYGHPGSTSR
jgi:hypothetical protein